ncbi:MAG TPA: LacI family DNA-binding transcriptional regulator [Jatrophihabitans sp.]
MRDVAVRAGVGVGTVSRVVNGGASVRPVTAERVQRAIEELGFQRNDVARALRPGMTSTTIALLIGNLANPFYAAIAKSVLDVARAAGYAVMVSSVDEDAESEKRAVRELFSRRIAGMMLVPVRRDNGFLQRAHRSDTPIVLIDRPAQGVENDAVVIDNDRGGFLATAHLIAHGHRRIAMLVAPSYYTTGQRANGYRRALRAAGLALDPSLVVTLEVGTVEAARVATVDLLGRRDRPTAVFATTNFVCEGTLRAMHAVGCQLAVVGFDDFRLADFLPVPATVVTPDADELGRRATELLLRRVAGDRGPARREVVPVRLVERGSGELDPPGRDAQPARPRPASPRRSVRAVDRGGVVRDHGRRT